MKNERISEISKIMFKEIIKLLFQDIYSLKIRGDTKITYKLKRGWFFYKKVKRSNIDILLCELPLLLSNFKHGNDSAVTYYLNSIENILDDKSLITYQSKIEALINFYYIEITKTKIVDIENMFIIKMLPKDPSFLLKSKNRVIIVNANSYETNDIEVFEINKSFNVMDTFLNITRNNIYSIKKISIAAMLLIYLNSNNLVNFITNLPINSPFHMFCNESAKNVMWLKTHFNTNYL